MFCLLCLRVVYNQSTLFLRHTRKHGPILCCSELARRDLNLIWVAVERALQLSKCSSLYLVCVLQFFNPVCLLGFEACDFPFNLHTFLVFLIDATDELLALLHPLLLFLHQSLLGGLFFLVFDHLLHALSLEFLRPFLNAYHFLVLLTLLFEFFSFAVVTFGLGHLLVSNCFLLLHAKILVADHKLAFFLLSLLR